MTENTLTPDTVAYEVRRSTIHGNGVFAESAQVTQHFHRLRTAVDEVAEQDKPVFGLKVEETEELGKFFVAAVDVADGDESPVHAAEKC